VTAGALVLADPAAGFGDRGAQPVDPERAEGEDPHRRAGDDRARLRPALERVALAEPVARAEGADRDRAEA
jgi:hypothetical protein